MKYLLLFITLLAFSSSDAKKKYYKWTDENGNIHYTEKKPTNKNSSEVKVSNRKPSETPTKYKETDQQSSNVEEKVAPEQANVDEYNNVMKEKTKAIQDKANCKVARDNLATLQRTVRVRQKDPETGEFVRLGDSERMQMLELSKQSIKDLCK